jgi:class 3 adenylate cyclase/tetratricopeptide (TPR) repeat protein
MSDSVRSWLEQLRLGQYADVFEENCIEADQLGSLTHDDLKELGVRALGHRKRIREAALERPPMASGAHDEEESRDLTARAVAASLSAAGERKHVTILFADVAGSTDLIQQLDAEASVERLAPAVAVMTNAVQHHGGTVNRVQGDGIMALFGAPLTQEDHAIRACLAALQIRDDAERLDDPRIRIRVGLNSGEVVVRAIQGDLTVEYEADGATVHLASRMEKLAEPGTVRCTAETFRLAEGHVEARCLGTPPIKGVDAPVEQFELSQPVAAASRWEARARRGLSQFVGRGTELTTIEEALTLAEEGRGQVVSIVGAPGMGKSRLVHEFLSERVPEHWTVRASASSSTDADTPYGLVRNLLRAVVEIEPGDPAYIVEERVAGFLDSFDFRSDTAAAAMHELLGLPPSDPHWQRIDPFARKQHIIDTFTALAVGRSIAAPLLLIFEDLHWADIESLASLDALVDRMPDSRILLLVTYRPEHRDRWSERSDCRRIQISGLALQVAETLVATLLGPDPSIRALAPLLVEATEGCPLFIEETIRSMVDEGRLEGGAGAYRLNGSVQRLRVPASVQSVIAARIDRLDPKVKSVLQTASVIGRVVPLTLLAHVIGAREEALADSLRKLQSDEFVFQRQLMPEVEYSFKHALTQSVAYEGLLRRRRTALHADVLDTMEFLYAETIGDHVESLARHAFEGARWRSAVGYLRQAADRATGQSAHAEARRHLERALTALGRLPDGPARTADAIDFRLGMKNMLLALGDFPAIGVHLDEAQRLAEPTGDARRCCRVYLHQCHYLWMAGEHERAVDMGLRASESALENADLESEVEALNRLGSVYHSLGRYRDGIEVLRRGGISIDERPDTPGLPQVYAQNFLCWNLVEVGEIDEALSISETNLEVAKASGLPWAGIDAAMGAGVSLLAADQPDRAVEVLEEALRLCRVGEIPMLYPWIATHLGAAYVRTGRLDEALTHLADAVLQADGMKMLANQPLRLVRLGEAQLRGGLTDEATRTAARALDLARVHGERGHEAMALALAGDIGIHDTHSDVDAAYHNALNLALELEMAPLAARCREALSSS